MLLWAHSRFWNLYQRKRGRVLWTCSIMRFFFFFFLCCWKQLTARNWVNLQTDSKPYRNYICTRGAHLKDAHTDTQNKYKFGSTVGKKKKNNNNNLLISQSTEETKCLNVQKLSLTLHKKNIKRNAAGCLLDETTRRYACGCARVFV